MIEENYVSFETAKLLKEKGFNWPCLHYWQEEISEFCIQKRILKWSNGEYQNMEIASPYRFSAPTLQMAIKWLRKNHQIFIRPNISFLYPIRYYCEIFCYGDNLKTQQDVTTENFESPEEACEAAIKYCLENLI
jgi:hypothetical protein